MTLYTVIEAWSHTLNINMLSNMCIALPWFFNIGLTLVLGTVCVKTYRLYYIYKLAKRGVIIGSKRMADPALIGYVGVFSSVDVLLCILWTCVDPLSLRYSKTITYYDNKPLPLVTVTGSCQSSWLLHWSSILILYKCVLVACSFFLALPTKLGQRKFETNNVLILSYILATLFGLGMPIYTIAQVIDVGVSLRFIVKCLFVDATIYICLFALFLPSIFSFVISFQPYAKGNYNVHKKKTVHFIHNVAASQPL